MTTNRPTAGALGARLTKSWHPDLPHETRWPLVIERSQAVAHLVTLTDHGPETLPRVRCGDEKDRPVDHCGDCGAVRGQYHVPSCDMERCPSCDGQLISCVTYGCPWGAAGFVTDGGP